MLAYTFKGEKRKEKEIPSTGHENIAQPKTDKWHHSTASHFSSFFTVSPLFQCRFVA